VDGSDGIAQAPAPRLASDDARRATARVRVSAALFRRPWMRAVLLLSAPGAWFVLIYLSSLALLFISALWSVESFSGKLVHSWTLENFETLFTVPAYRTIALRTVGIAAAVTVTDALLALPFAFFATRIAPSRLRAALFVAVLIPLWSSYLVRVYVWRLILAKDGILNWTLEKLGLGSLEIGYSNWAMWIVFSYIWLPFMILPIWAAIERVPDSYIEASADLGARGWRTFRTVLFPLILPGIAAGSIFTFALTLGDFITPTLVGGAGSDFIGNVVYQNVGVANNVPFAAAFATVPLVIMGLYLLIARRLGAFEAL
jgi:putative spermidine/putrescine transport system permease protein